MIYIDPPYGIKFASNFQPEVGKRDVKDKESDMIREPEMVKAYRDTWHLGVHSYLAYLRDRLIVAKELLADTGSVFVQIGDENLHLVGTILDEIFGHKNFLQIIGFKKSGAQSTDKLPSNFDFLLWYAKDTVQVKARLLTIPKGNTGAIIGQDIWEETKNGELRQTNIVRLADAPQDVMLFTHRQVASPGLTEIGSYEL
jgi:adenine-specific DNA-methyltransferase